jgi:hypothetical protein
LRSENRELTLSREGLIGLQQTVSMARPTISMTAAAWLPLMALLKERDLSIGGQVFPRSVAELAPALEMATEFGCHHITIQADICPMTVGACLPILEGWQQMAEQTHVPVYIERHRGGRQTICSSR